MKVTVIPVVIGAFGTFTKWLVQGLGNKRAIRDHPNYSIVEVGQDIEKSLGDLRRLAIAQTSVRNHWLTLVWKTRKGVTNNIQTTQTLTEHKQKNNCIDIKRQTSEISRDKTWIWLRKGNPKRETESFLIQRHKDYVKTTP